ncbi:hypothetical protein [Paraburkholderia ferrariae]|jgi:hypothetical protein|uniref:hypothetical protein n=1 Tax=Paraburkholderia ferrariae TaxID=386056 RepID=UPI00047FE390|nr:hypothetical protein [Paraburkholderia ferrariae]
MAFDRAAFALAAKHHAKKTAHAPLPSRIFAPLSPWAHLIGPHGLSLRAARKTRVAAEKINRKVLAAIARFTRIAARPESVPKPFNFADALAVTVPSASELEHVQGRERSRCKRIMEHGAAHDQTSIAVHLAFESGMSSRAAIELLDSLRSVQCIVTAYRDRRTSSASTSPFLSHGEAATQIVTAGRKARGEK